MAMAQSIHVILNIKQGCPNDHGRFDRNITFFVEAPHRRKQKEIRILLSAIERQYYSNFQRM